MYKVMGFKEYKNYLNELISEEASGKSYGKRVLNPARRYFYGEGESRMPIPLAGYTIITPPKKDDDCPSNEDAYRVLKTAYTQLASVEGIVPAPEKEWHMTLADLVSQGAYAALLAEGKEEALVTEVRQLFEKMETLDWFPKCEMRIKGIGLFSECVIAAVAPADRIHYRVLREFKHYIYEESPELKKLGVERNEPYGYGFHITLAYVEAYLTECQRSNLTDKLRTINKGYSKDGVPFTVHTAELRKFDNMDCFDRVEECRFKFCSP